MSEAAPYREDESDASRERRRGRLDYSADDYDEPSDWRRPEWRPDDREDPRERGTPFLAFAVIVLMAVVLSVALWFVLRQQELTLVPGSARVRIERPSMPTPGPASLPSAAARR